MTHTRSKAFGLGSCVYIGWAQRSTAPEAILERAAHLHRFVAGIESHRIEGACIHTLRHSFASLAINAGASLYDVSKLLGHSTTQTTTRYAHHERGALLRASEQAASQLARTGTEG